MTLFWHKILSVIDNKNVVIQSKGISLDIETALIRDLVQEMQHLLDSWVSVVQEAKVVAEGVEVQFQFLENRKTSIEPEQDFRSSVVYPVLDFIINNLKTRFEAADATCELFSPILNFQNLDDVQLTAKAAKLVNTYEKDLSEYLLHEIIYLKSIYMIIFGIERSPIRLLNAIYGKKNC